MKFSLGFIITFMRVAGKRFPILAARHILLVFLIGAIIILMLGIAVFYQYAYIVVTEPGEDAFVSVKKVNQKLYDEALEFLDAQRHVPGPLPGENPFLP